MAKSIKANFLYNILLNVSKVIFPLITAPYVARVLEPDGVGLFNFAFNYANYFAFFAALGIPFYGIREIAKIKNDRTEQEKFVSEVISISLLATIVSVIIFLLSLWLVPQLNENYVVFLVSGIVLYISPIKIDWYYSGKEEFGYITFRSLIIKTLSVLCLFVFVHDKEDLLLYVCLNASCNALNEVWNYVKLYSSGIHPYFTLSGTRHLKPLFILFSSNIAISIYVVLDTLMLGFLTDYTEVGYYNSATHVSKTFIPVVTSLAAVVLPRISVMRENNQLEEINTLMNKSFSIVGFLSFPLAIGLITLAPVFVPLFFGDQFMGTITPLIIVSLLIIVIGFNNLTGVQVLLGFGLDKNFLYSIVAGASSNFLLNLVLIPYLGASGAAISSVFAEMVVLGTMLYYIYKLTPVRFNCKKELVFNLLVSLIFLLIGRAVFGYVPGWLGVGVTAFCCLIFYLVAQYLLKSSSEQELLRIISSKLGHKRIV